MHQQQQQRRSGCRDLCTQLFAMQEVLICIMLRVHCDISGAGGSSSGQPRRPLAALGLPMNPATALPSERCSVDPVELSSFVCCRCWWSRQWATLVTTCDSSRVTDELWPFFAPQVATKPSRLLVLHARCWLSGRRATAAAPTAAARSWAWAPAHSCKSARSWAAGELLPQHNGLC